MGGDHRTCSRGTFADAHEVIYTPTDAIRHVGIDPA
jgi:hypothetical protein